MVTQSGFAPIIHHARHEAEGQDAFSDALPILTTYTMAGDVLNNSNDTERSVTATSYTKIKEIKINERIDGYRAKFDLTCKAVELCYGRIYKNGIAIGSQHSTSSNVYVTFSDDLSGLVEDDLLQIYVYSPPDGANIVYVQNFRLYYTINIGRSTTNQDPA
jgi:hypothetical protein